jgi:hypothetical protein
MYILVFTHIQKASLVFTRHEEKERDTKARSSDINDPLGLTNCDQNGNKDANQVSSAMCKPVSS